MTPGDVSIKPLVGLGLITTIRRIRDLEKNTQESNKELDMLNKEIMILKTSISNRELENCKLDDDTDKLDQELKHSKNDIDKLHEFEVDSFLSLRNMHERQVKELNLLHEEKLMNLKEETSNAVIAAMERAKRESKFRKEELEKDVETLRVQIRAHVTEMNRSLIKLKENHHKNLIELNANMEEIVSGLVQDKIEIENSTTEKLARIESLKKDSSSELESQISVLHQDLKSLNEKFDFENADILELKAELSASHLELKEAKSSCSSKLQVLGEYFDSAERLRSLIPSLEDNRRSLHNKLQELKGNIRVFCRVRPISRKSDEVAFLNIASDQTINENGKEVLRILNEDHPYHSLHSFRQNQRMNIHDFEFDKLFGKDKSNKDIFPEISQLVQSALDGFNVSVFAYGQTGSGKTWTMSHADDGMIPLSFTKIFSDISDLKSQGWNYDVEGQFIEIYNEQIFDLLSNSTESLKCEIKHDDESKRTTVTNVTIAKMKCANEALKYLNDAIKKRSTASTMANERSSRSHLVFMLKITGTHKELGKLSAGTLNLIDLAGSERLRNSQAKGDRLKETQAINKSLSCLGDVIHGLARQSPQHIPYRNSKLTYLLKYSLGGLSKTLMFVNISPLKANLSETINSLRFATKVNGTKLQ